MTVDVDGVAYERSSPPVRHVALVPLRMPADGVEHDERVVATTAHAVVVLRLLAAHVELALR